MAYCIRETATSLECEACSREISPGFYLATDELYGEIKPVCGQCGESLIQGIWKLLEAGNMVPAFWAVATAQAYPPS